MNYVGYVMSKLIDLAVFLALTILFLVLAQITHNAGWNIVSYGLIGIAICLIIGLACVICQLLDEL